MLGVAVVDGTAEPDGAAEGFGAAAGAGPPGTGIVTSSRGAPSLPTIASAEERKALRSICGTVPLIAFAIGRLGPRISAILGMSSSR
ncbi:hypothetical protein TSST111916_05230 [Tsukamurella strandjordii]